MLCEPCRDTITLGVKGLLLWGLGELSQLYADLVYTSVLAVMYEHL